MKLAPEIAEYERVGLDTSPLIYALDAIEPYVGPARMLLTMAENGELQLFVSGISELELLVKPLRQDDRGALRKIRVLLNDFPNLHLVPARREVLQLAAKLRAKENLRTPDAIIAASAILTGCDCLIGNDRTIQKRLKSISYLCLDDFVPSGGSLTGPSETNSEESSK